MYNNDFKMDGVKHTQFLTAAQQHSEFLTAQQHTLLSGMASYDGGRNFLFSPDEPMAGLLPRFRCHGIAQQMTDGTFDFVAKPKVKPQSQLIKKLAHGRVSKTKDGAIQLTLKVYSDEGENIAEAIYKEAGIAKDAIVDYQMKR